MELREGWNFHNDIAIELESIAREFFGDIDRPYNKIYDADSIENEYFAETMIFLILTKQDCIINDEQDEFIRKCYKYIGKSSINIDNKEADKLLKEFKKIF